MKPEMSEFSYGYAITEAFVQRLAPALTAAPLFPSLFREGQPGGGYDVMLKRRGIPLFFQFKLADCMVRGSADEVKRGLLSPPFYRMHLRPANISNQHQMLFDLERSGQEVYYVAPLFYTSGEFNATYLGRQMLQQSVFFRPMMIGALPDAGPHHIAYSDQATWFFLSEPRRMEVPISDESLVSHVHRAVEERGDRGLTEGAWRELVEKMLVIVDSRQIEHRRGGERVADMVRLFRRESQRMHPVEQAAYISRAFLESECVVVWQREPAP